MSQERYYYKGVEKPCRAGIANRRDKIERHERNEQDREIRIAKRIGGSRFLAERNIK